MRKILGRAATSLTRFARGAGKAQGLVGVACVASGVFMLAGLGFALVAVGAFLLLGAWGNR